MSQHDIVRAASMMMRDLAPLRDAGLVAFGIDDRTCGSEWGEVYGPTSLVFIVTSGTMAYLGKDAREELRVGDLITVPQRCVKWFTAPNGPARAVWFHFVPEICPVAMDPNAAQVYSCSSTALFEAIVDQFLARGFKVGNTSTALTRILADLVLAALQEIRVRPVSPADAELQQRFSAIWDRVSGNLVHNWTVGELADALCVSPGHFHRICRARTLASPMGMVRRLRLERAAHLLVITNAPLDDIAERVGYTSPYSFSQAFTRFHGVRPGRYRVQGRGGDAV